MKRNLLIPVFTSSVLALGAIAIFNRPTLAEDTTSFFCDTSQGVPATLAHTPRGNVTMIRWVNRNYFPAPWTPARRCQEVSRRFQKNYEAGTLVNIASGALHGEPVICAAANQGEACTSETLLFTLKRGSKANVAVRRLLARSDLATGNVLNESSCKDECPVYINLPEYLKKAPVETNTRFKSPSTPPQQESSNTPWWYRN